MKNILPITTKYDIIETKRMIFYQYSNRLELNPIAPFGQHILEIWHCILGVTEVPRTGSRIRLRPLSVTLVVTHSYLEDWLTQFLIAERWTNAVIPFPGSRPRKYSMFLEKKLSFRLK